METENFLLEVRNIYKSFHHVQALSNACFAAPKGMVTAIVGDNGSGKSTLAKIISGCIKPDAGEILLNGKHYASLTCRQAIYEGSIAAVYQDLALDNAKNAYENVFLGREDLRFQFFLNKKKMKEKAAALFASLCIDIPDMELPVGNMSGGQRQAIAIARAIDMNCQILIFDEPTSAMGMKETRHTMDLFQRLKQEGRTILLISHNLFQVFDIADRIAVLDKGHFVDTFATKESTPQKLHDRIVKKEMELER